MGDLDDRDDELWLGVGTRSARCLESGKRNRLFLVDGAGDRVAGSAEMGRAGVCDLACLCDSDVDVV